MVHSSKWGHISTTTGNQCRLVRRLILPRMLHPPNESADGAPS
jgi:hypothetical protein